jgi:hypothetical protein
MLPQKYTFEVTSSESPLYWTLMAAVLDHVVARLKLVVVFCARYHNKIEIITIYKFFIPLIIGLYVSQKSRCM